MKNITLYLLIAGSSILFVTTTNAFVGPTTTTTTTTTIQLNHVSSFSFPTTSTFAQKSTATTSTSATTTALQMGLFDGKFSAFGSASREELDAEYEKQQEILRERRKPKKERDIYFQKVEERRQLATKKQQDMWSWQTKTYKKGEDPITEWKKRRADGTISDLENQYGDPKKIGGIPLPGASFGVGGEFGVGGKFDNGGRFDLRLPYADQGYVDEDADVMKKLGSFFGGNKKKETKNVPPTPEPPKKKQWPW